MPPLLPTLTPADSPPTPSPFLTCSRLLRLTRLPSPKSPEPFEKIRPYRRAFQRPPNKLDWRNSILEPSTLNPRRLRPYDLSLAPPTLASEVVTPNRSALIGPYKQYEECLQQVGTLGSMKATFHMEFRRFLVEGCRVSRGSLVFSQSLMGVLDLINPTCSNLILNIQLLLL